MRIRQAYRTSHAPRDHATEALITAAVLATLAASVPAQRQFDELGNGVFPVGDDLAHAVALGDVDGDGDLDTVFGTRHQRQNRLYLNNGSGTFADDTAARLPVDGDGTMSVALGDVDGDGDLDMVLANLSYSVRQNRLYLNDGNGAYTDATAARLPTDTDSTRDVALGDVDGDGDLDIVFGNSDFPYGQQNRLYLNDGSGTFADATPARLPATSDQTWAAALGDVDGDGDLDIVLGNDGQNRLCLNDGSGTYTDATTARLPADSDVTLAMALGDVDGDGDLDVVFGGGRQQNRLYLNDGSGAFTDATVSRMPVDSDDTHTVALGDVDKDGDLDLVFGNGARGQQNRLYLNDGAGSFTDVTAQLMPTDRDITNAVALGDIDGDGDLDMVLGNYGRQNRLYLNDSTGTFIDTTATRLPTQIEPTRAVALGDVDGDEDLDMVLGNGGENQLYLNDGAGFFTDATELRLPADNDPTRAVALGDVDGDGDLDIAFGNDGYRVQNRLYLNDGSGTFADATATHLPADGHSTGTHAVAMGDVDGDGDLDMLFGNSATIQHRLYLNDGTGTYIDDTAARLPPGRDFALALGDVDGDGDLDAVAGSSGQNRLYLNDGSGVFTDATAGRLPPDGDSTDAVALGDVDGDGDLDIVFGNPYQFQNKLYLNDGSGAYIDATALGMPADQHGTGRDVALGDVDGDGDLDMVLGNDGQNRIYLNDGSGTFTDATAERMPAHSDDTFAVGLGDLDNDGDFDMIFGNTGSAGHNRLYLNLLRQLHTPVVMTLGREFQVEGYALHGPQRPGDIALGYISTARASMPLPPLGTIGIDLSRSAALPPFFIPQPEGLGSVSFTVPVQPSLIGVSVYAQALLVPFGGPWHLTNVTSAPIVR